MQLLIGIIIGIVVANIGFTGLARVLDNGVQKVQSVSKEAVK